MMIFFIILSKKKCAILFYTQVRKKTIETVTVETTTETQCVEDVDKQ